MNFVSFLNASMRTNIDQSTYNLPGLPFNFVWTLFTTVQIDTSNEKLEMHRYAICILKNNLGGSPCRITITMETMSKFSSLTRRTDWCKIRPPLTAAFCPVTYSADALKTFLRQHQQHFQAPLSDQTAPYWYFLLVFSCSFKFAPLVPPLTIHSMIPQAPRCTQERSHSRAHLTRIL